MVKHIVMWKIKDQHTTETKVNTMIKIKDALEGLGGSIEGLVDIEVGINFNSSDAAYDLLLYSLFESKESLAYYQAHPKHMEIADTLVRPVTESRVVVDYEV